MATWKRTLTIVIAAILTCGTAAILKAKAPATQPTANAKSELAKGGEAVKNGDEVDDDDEGEKKAGKKHEVDDDDVQDEHEDAD